MTFGEFVRAKRLIVNLGLREFCELAEVDSSNWSKIERDRLPVTTEREKLEMIAQLIGLEKGTSDWHTFFDLASLSQQKVPQDIYSDEEVLEVLPIFFRTVRGDKPKPEELDKLIELIKHR
jgi:transcriptional regulator with XRE-family HTH domain